MSEAQNDTGEAQQTSNTTSSNTQQSNDLDGTQEDTFGLEKEVVDACLAIVHEYRAGIITKAHATLQLHEAFPETLEETPFIEAYSTYFKMLDNFDHFRDTAEQRGRAEEDIRDPEDTVDRTTRRHTDAPRPRTEGQSRRPRASISSDEEDDGYKKRMRLDFDALPWNKREASESAVQLSPSLQKTQSLLANFARDVKRAKASLLNCGRPYPQFPDSEWGSLLSGKSVDFDHVLSSMYSVSHDNRESQPLGKELEIIGGTSKPARAVRTHGEWIMAFNAYVDAALFIFAHRERELRGYGNHIMRYFASMPTELHDRIINYDKAVRIRVAQRRDLELTEFEQLSDLQLQWVNNPAKQAGTTPSTSKSGRKPGQRRDPCRRWNEQRCPNTGPACNYAHICSKCRSNAHTASECKSSQQK
jgi:hypothetical protein